MGAHPASAEYRISAGDTLEVTALSIPAFKQEATVGIDGTIMVPLLGEVPAVGLTLTELRQILQKSLPAKAVRQRNSDGKESIAVIEPDEIGVRIAKYQPVYLSGDVTKQGEHPFHPGMTVRQAIALAGGYNLLRFRMENPVVETANLRAEYDSVWASIARESANVWRLKAIIAAARADKAPAPPPAATDAALGAPGSRATVAQKLAEQQLRLQISDITKEKEHLQRSLARSQTQLASLTEQQAKEKEGVTADADEYDQVRALFQRGAVVTTRLTDARRSVLLSSTRALQTLVQVTQLERDKSDVARKLERVDDQQALDALEKLQVAESNLTALRSRLNSVNDKLVYTGALRTQLLSGSRARASLAVFRQNKTSPDKIDAAEETELQPGDVVEVLLKPDPALRGIGDGTGQN
ncbi:polysaccharide biosynthesis/export family protein [Methylobacterium sp. NEAU K]|uniref:polysaccharide biosynthesis/export family protein n=1 Tax=Methylobacterium sp. NEAU K TaxID=3064946 RepID=UPI0027340D9F|nr:polysaccharide biosynthesis/export family protein [Methylobacterium sp. NEAU K]MDP4005833.1 polysaccharide biosynthesis/export family protein [Methylobacterium sp. NEAU K]